MNAKEMKIVDGLANMCSYYPEGTELEVLQRFVLKEPPPRVVEILEANGFTVNEILDVARGLILDLQLDNGPTQ
jgi:hypothetical protein